jgi:uncharacterized delta-60 repeat protein
MVRNRRFLACSFTLALLLPLTAMAGQGDLDSTFNGTGYAVWDGSGAEDTGNAVTIQPGGTILVGGTTDPGFDRNVLMLRYTSTGSLDAGFNGTGSAIWHRWGEEGNAVGHLDGRSLVAGYCNSNTETGEDALVLARTPSGDLDPAFSGDGVALFNLGGGDHSEIVRGMTVSGGSVFLTGWMSSGPDWDLFLLKLTSAGAPDATFGGGDGLVTVDRVPLISHGGTDIDDPSLFGYDVKVHGDRIYVLANMEYSAIALLRFDAAGNLDASFGDGGFSPIYHGSVSSPVDGIGATGFSLAIQGDGKPVVAGEKSALGSDLVVLRYTAAGAFDADFATGGEFVFDSTAHFAYQGTGYDRAMGVAIQNDGKIVVAGYYPPDHDRDEFPDVDSDVLVLRLTTAGSLDPAFGSGGLVGFDGPLGLEDRGHSVALQPNGRIVVTGVTWNTAPFNNYDVLTLRLLGEEISPPDIDLDPDPPSANFGTVNVGSSAVRTFTIANTGSAPLTVTEINRGANAAFSFALAGASPCSSWTPTLAPGASCTFEATFTPAAAGPFKVTLSITSNDPDESPLTTTLFGNGGITDTPDIDLDPAPPSFHFGTVNVGSGSTLTLTLANVGTAPLTVTEINRGANAAFSFALAGGSPCSSWTPALGGGASCTFTATFTPAAAGPSQVTLSITSNDPDENPLAITLSGNGAITATPDIDLDPDPPTFAFGEVAVGSSKAQVFTLSNTGGAPLTVQGFIFSGSTDFARNLAGPSPCPSWTPTLAPGASCTFSITFTPTAAAARTASIALDSDDPDEDPLALQLTGSGTKDSGTITVVSPNGGERWRVGSKRTIRWSFTGNPAAKVKIELIKNNLRVLTIHRGWDIGFGGEGYYQWLIPKKKVALGNRYRIRLTAGDAQDVSNRTFTLLKP